MFILFKTGVDWLPRLPALPTAPDKDHHEHSDPHLQRFRIV